MLLAINFGPHRFQVHIMWIMVYMNLCELSFIHHLLKTWSPTLLLLLLLTFLSIEVYVRLSLWLVSYWYTISTNDVDHFVPPCVTCLGDTIKSKGSNMFMWRCNLIMTWIEGTKLEADKVSISLHFQIGLVRESPLGHCVYGTHVI